MSTRRRASRQRVRLGTAARFVAADVGSAQEAERLVTETCAAFDGLDILVNNAGIVHRGRFPRPRGSRLRPRAAGQSQGHLPRRPGGGRGRMVEAVKRAGGRVRWST